jgi:hypothetical protein
LLGGGDVLNGEAGSDPEQMEAWGRAETEAELRARLGEDAYATAYADGRRLTLDDALALALRPA